MPHFDEPGKRLRNREGRRPGDCFDHPACAAQAGSGFDSGRASVRSGVVAQPLVFKPVHLAARGCRMIESFKPGWRVSRPLERC